MKLKTLLAALLLAGFAINTKAQTTDEDLDAKYATSLVQPGTVAPDFTMNTPDGKPFSLSSLKGKTVVLDFWASWCPDCRKDMPELNKLYEEFASDSVVFINISYDTDKEVLDKAAAYLGEKGTKGTVRDH